MSTRLSASDEKPMRVREDSLEECVVLERGRWCVCVRSFPIGSIEVLLREKVKRGGGGGLAQFHELMKNDLAESSVLCPRLGLDGWGLEGGMRRNIDGRGEALAPVFFLFLCLFLNSFYIVILHLHFVPCLCSLSISFTQYFTYITCCGPHIILNNCTSMYCD